MEAELKRFLKLEEEFWKQKSSMTWFVHGDNSTKLFHSYVQGRRKKLHIFEISDEQGLLIISVNQISNAAVNHFINQFKKDHFNHNFEMLKYIPKLIDEEENEKMVKLPKLDEVKRVIFDLNGNSACGPDGFIGLFFQSSCEIISKDITKVVRTFFCGQQLPKFITHTNLVPLPKKEVVKNFSEMRPISLSYFINKVISRMLHERMMDVPPKIISLVSLFLLKGEVFQKMCY